MFQCPKCGSKILLVELDTYIVFDVDKQSGNIALRWIKRVLCNECGTEFTDGWVVNLARDLSDSLIKALSSVELKLPRDANV